MVELVFKAMHGERFQSCETKIFKNSDGRIKFLLKFPMRNCFKVLSMQPRMTGLLTTTTTTTTTLYFTPNIQEIKIYNNSTDNDRGTGCPK